MSDTDTITAALAGLRCRERELELEAVAVKARVEEIRDMIERLEPRRRVGRPRAAAALNPYPSQNLQQAINPPHSPQELNTQLNMPGRVAGGQHGYAERGDGTLKAPIATETDLPSLDDVQGILKPEETAA